MKEVYFLTFAAGRPCWYRSASRLVNQFKQTGIAGSTIVVTPENLKDFVPQDYKSLLSMADTSKRAYGFWFWKPLIVLGLIDRMKFGDIMWYLDAGSTINLRPSALTRLNSYFQSVETHDSLFFQQNTLEKNFTKPAVFDAIDPYRKFSDTGQLLGGNFFLKKTAENVEFLKMWVNLSSKDNFSLLYPSAEFETKTTSHRHDQSIASLLAKKCGLFSIPDETYFGTNWHTLGADYPIWITRNCSGFDLTSKSIFIRAWRQIEMRLNF